MHVFDKLSSAAKYLSKLLIGYVKTANGSNNKSNIKIKNGSENFLDLGQLSDQSLLEVNFFGVGNRVSILDGAKIRGSISVRGNNSCIEIGQNVSFNGRIVVKGGRQRLTIGQNSTFQSAYILADEGEDVEIGSDCMFSRDIEIRTSDAHSIIDRDTCNRINLPGSVIVGHHCWVGVGVIISKGSLIPQDSVIGAKSFVNKKFYDSHTVIAGSPAKVVRSNITWTRKRVASVSRRDIDLW